MNSIVKTDGPARLEQTKGAKKNIEDGLSHLEFTDFHGIASLRLFDGRLKKEPSTSGSLVNRLLQKKKYRNIAQSLALNFHCLISGPLLSLSRRA